MAQMKLKKCIHILKKYTATFIAKKDRATRRESVLPRYLMQIVFYVENNTNEKATLVIRMAFWGKFPYGSRHTLRGRLGVSANLPTKMYHSYRR